MHLVASTRTKFGMVAEMPAAAQEDGLWQRIMVVVAKLIGAAWAGGKLQDTRHMKVLEALPIGAKKHLFLISCDGERFLVGAGPDSVETIVRVRPETATREATQDVVR